MRVGFTGGRTTHLDKESLYLLTIPPRRLQDRYPYAFNDTSKAECSLTTWLLRHIGKLILIEIDFYFKDYYFLNLFFCI